MSVAREKFLLQLDNFQLETPEFRRQLWEEKDLTDVTLATGDGQQILSHRVILSAQSSFFKRILLRNWKQQNLVIYLKDFHLPELELLLELMYLGRVEIPKDLLDSVLALGQELGFQGMEGISGDLNETRLEGRVSQDGGTEEVCKTEPVREKVVKSQDVTSNEKTQDVASKEKTTSCHGNQIEQPPLEIAASHNHQKEKLTNPDRPSRLDQIGQISCLRPRGISKATAGDKQRKNISQGSGLKRDQGSPDVQTLPQKKRSRPTTVFTCDACGTQFLAETTLKQHKISVHA